VKQLIAAHGGSVEVRSGGAGKGSVFIVRLPVLQSASNERDGTAASMRARRAKPLSRHKIVVADDVEESADLLARILQSLGQDVVVAHDGKSAIESADTCDCELAIIDIAMPGMDGYEVARRLRARPRTRSMLLVALTGFCREHDRQRAFEAGFNYHLAKPATLEELEQLLRTAFLPDASLAPVRNHIREATLYQQEVS
jgi:CheY-like chemotaxis protein